MTELQLRNDPAIDDLVVIHARTDRDALGLLYDATYPHMMRYCTRRIGRRDLAEDVVSTVYLSVAVKIRDFPGETFVDFRRWIFFIATNEVNATFRKTSRRHAILAKAVDENVFPKPADRDRSELSAAAGLQAAILFLSEREQSIVSMRFFAGLPHDDIAAVLNMTPGAVRTALSRCLRKLRQRLENET